jgi:hypothetical protein
LSFLLAEREKEAKLSGTDVSEGMESHNKTLLQTNTF